MRANGRGFTLVEILIVIAIVGILASLTVVCASAAITKTRTAQASVELRGMVSALRSYHAEFSAYPPDTDAWNEGAFDPRSIHRYLGSRLEASGARKLEPMFHVELDRVRDRDAGGVGVYLDPWGNPYRMDAVHMRLEDGELRRTGEPYLPTRRSDERVRDVKVVSFGPDGRSDPSYPFDWAAEHVDARDDVRSW